MPVKPVKSVIKTVVPNKPASVVDDDSAESYSEYTYSDTSEYEEHDGGLKPNDSEEKLGSDNDEQEEANEYNKGGYCPVVVGDFYYSRYQVIRKLGWGAFSTVWLGWDMKRNIFVALKIMKSKRSYYESAKDEVDLLESLREVEDGFDSERAAQLLNYFTVDSVNGTHFVMVFEVLGPNLYKFLMKSKYKGLPVDVVRVVLREVLKGLDYLHSKCKIIHTDLKPENICICVTESYIHRIAIEAYEWQNSGAPPPSAGHVASHIPKPKTTLTRNQKRTQKNKEKKKEELSKIVNEQIREASKKYNVDLSKSGSHLLPDLLDPKCIDIKCKVADLGNACWTYKHFASDIQTRQYMSPEVFVRAGYDCSADIWSMACTAYEIATGTLLFKPRTQEHWTKDEDHLRQYTEFIIGAYGKWPRRLLLHGEKTEEFFNADGTLKNTKIKLTPWTVEQRLVDRGMDKVVAVGFAKFLVRMLNPDPIRRPSAVDLLNDPWLQTLNT